MKKIINLPENRRAERKLLLTVAEWENKDNGKSYVVQTKQPGNWETNYTDYFTRTGSAEPYTYEAVTGSTAPTWAASTYYTRIDRELLGRRTEDSSIEYNPDIETSTDILGINYSDVNRTQPEQSFDPFLILGGSALAAKLDDIRRRNAISELDQFTVYIITGYIGDAQNGYAAEKQENCTITYDSLGGDANVNFPITVHFSNNTTHGTVDKLGSDFTFTPAAGSNATNG